MNAHLTDQQLHAYLHQTLTDAERETLDVHLTSCPTCRARLSELDILQQWVRRELATELRAVNVPLSLTFEAIAPQLNHTRSAILSSARSRSFALLAIVASVAMAILALNLITRFSSVSAPTAQSLTEPFVTPSPTADLSSLHVPATFGNDVKLNGYQLVEDHVMPGARLSLELYWGLSRYGDYTSVAHILNSQNQIVAQADVSLDPLRKDSLDRPVLPYFNSQAYIDLPLDLPPGQYQIAVGIYDTQSGQRLITDQGETTATIGTIEVEASLARFGDVATLIDIMLSSYRLKPGDTLTLDLSWDISQAEGYTSFVHVFDSQDRLVAQADLSLDAIKASNVRGQPDAPYLIGQSKLQLPIDLLDGEYQIAVGIYDDQTGQRVTTWRDETAMPIGTIEVRSDWTETTDTKHVHLINQSTEYTPPAVSHFERAIRVACADLGCETQPVTCVGSATDDMACSPYSPTLTITVYMDSKATAIYGWMNDDRLMFKMPTPSSARGPLSIFEVPDSLALLVEKVARSVYGWPPQKMNGVAIFYGIVNWEAYQLDQRYGSGKLADPFQPDQIAGATLPPLESLWGSDSIVSETREMQSEAAALIAFVEKEFGAPAVGKLLRAIGHANSLPEAIESSLNLKYPDFEQRWRDWLKQYNLK